LAALAASFAAFATCLLKNQELSVKQKYVTQNERSKGAIRTSPPKPSTAASSACQFRPTGRRKLQSTATAYSQRYPCFPTIEYMSSADEQSNITSKSYIESAIFDIPETAGATNAVLLRNSSADIRNC
jgi:hypothetical protein